MYNLALTLYFYFNLMEKCLILDTLSSTLFSHATTHAAFHNLNYEGQLYNLRLGMTLLLQSDLLTVGKPQIFFPRGSYTVVPAININIYYATCFIYKGTFASQFTVCS